MSADVCDLGACHDSRGMVQGCLQDWGPGHMGVTRSPQPPISLPICCKVSQPPSQLGLGHVEECHMASSLMCLGERQNLVKSEAACSLTSSQILGGFLWD